MRAVIGIWLGILGKAVRAAAFVLFLPCMRWMTGTLCVSPRRKSSEAMGWNRSPRSYLWGAAFCPLHKYYRETEKEANVAMRRVCSS